MNVRAFHLLPRNSRRLMCAYREPWEGPHPLCDAEVVRVVTAFHAAVVRGEYNVQGYTPNEWKAKMRTQESS